VKVSIAMATYNGAAFIEEQLQSFLYQTRQPDELIITDDGSTDKTLDIIRTFAERAPFKVWWDQNEQNLGYAGNFNKALRHTTGDLVFLSDQDDVWFPEKIDTLAQRASESSALVLMNNAVLTDANLNELGLTKLGQIRAAGLPNSYFVMGCCAAIKRDLLDLCLPVPKDYPAHDYWIVKFA
jgi:glycosyltransferase involved in cell wall biosynthesis